VRYIRGLQPHTLRLPANALLGALTIVLALSLAPPPAAGASLSWSTQALPSGGRLVAVSCPSEALCVAVNHEGDALTSTDPTASNPSWSSVAVAGGGAELTGVSCAPGGPCVAVESKGSAFVNLSPGSSSWARMPPLGAAKLTGVSCPSASLCVAVDEAGDVWTNTSPGVGVWTPTEFPAESGEEHRWSAVSCASSSLCVAVDAQGELIGSTNPTGGRGAWHEQKLDAGALLAVSCASSALCVAVGEAGETLASADPAEAAPSWTITPVDSGEALTGVACTALGLCAAVGDAGSGLVSANASANVPSWSQARDIDASGLTGVACVPSGFCVAVDDQGDALRGHVPAPGVTTLAPTQLTSAGALLAGVVEPNAATLGTCVFEYGPGAAGAALTQSLPCSLAPAAITARAEVSAQLSALQPNTTYHYRLAAANAIGTGSGEEVTFTTAVSPLIALVFPHPSITGTPAVGQRLTCHPGTPAGTEAKLSYAWVRDQIPIPDTDETTYTVKGQDSGHHLQCQVTATDGGGSATAKSAFVTIPRGGVPVSAGETIVGGATFAHDRVSVPITCSPHAAGGCRVALRLAVVETLSDGHVVAVAARAPRPARGAGHARGREAGLRHVTLTLASVSTRLPTGAHTTLSAGVGSSGRRLLGALRRFSAYVYVRGTVIGTIEAQLARELVTLSSSSGHAARHAHRRS